MTTEGVGLLDATVPPETPDRPESTGTVYVVQVLEEIEVELPRDPELEAATEYATQEIWRDIGQVELPKRGRRKAAVEQVLEREENRGLRPSGEIVRRFRALDVDSAEEIPAREKREPRLVVG